MANQKQWWFIDGRGRKIGYIWPEDFSSLLEAYYGKTWVKDFGAFAGISLPSIYRYRDGEQPIPKVVALLILMLGTHKARGLTPEEPDADWLPNAEIDDAYRKSTMD